MFKKTDDLFWPNVQTLTRFLRNQEIGTEVGYEEMDAHVGIRIQAKDRNVLHRARRNLEEEGIFYEVLYNVGITRVSHETRTQIYSTKGLKGVRRKIKREVNVASNIIYTELSDSGKHSWNSTSSLYAFLGNATSPKGVKKLDAACKEHSGRVLSSEEVNKLFA